VVIYKRHSSLDIVAKVWVS